MNWETGVGISTLPELCIEWITNENLQGTVLSALWRPKWEGYIYIYIKGDIGICMADSLCCMVETNKAF